MHVLLGAIASAHHHAWVRREGLAVIHLLLRISPHGDFLSEHFSWFFWIIKLQIHGIREWLWGIIIYHRVLVAASILYFLDRNFLQWLHMLLIWDRVVHWSALDHIVINGDIINIFSSSTEWGTYRLILVHLSPIHWSGGGKCATWLMVMHIYHGALLVYFLEVIFLLWIKVGIYDVTVNVWGGILRIHITSNLLILTYKLRGLDTSFGHPVSVTRMICWGRKCLPSSKSNFSWHS